MINSDGLTERFFVVAIANDSRLPAVDRYSHRTVEASSLLVNDLGRSWLDVLVLWQLHSASHSHDWRFRAITYKAIIYELTTPWRLTDLSAESNYFNNWTSIRSLMTNMLYYDTYQVSPLFQQLLTEVLPVPQIHEWIRRSSWQNNGNYISIQHWPNHSGHFFLLVYLQKRKLVEIFYSLKIVLRKNHYLYSARFCYSMYNTSVKTKIFSIRKEMKTNFINWSKMCRTYTCLIPFIEAIIRIRILLDRVKIWVYEKVLFQIVSSFFEDRKNVN